MKIVFAWKLGRLHIRHESITNEICSRGLSNLCWQGVGTGWFSNCRFVCEDFLIQACGVLVIEDMYVADAVIKESRIGGMCGSHGISFTGIWAGGGEDVEVGSVGWVSSPREGRASLWEKNVRLRIEFFPRWGVVRKVLELCDSSLLFDLLVLVQFVFLHLQFVLLHMPMWQAQQYFLLLWVWLVGVIIHG